MNEHANAYLILYRGVYDNLFYKIFLEKDRRFLVTLGKKRKSKYIEDLALLLSSETDDLLLLENFLNEIKTGIFDIRKENQANYLWDKILPIILQLKDYFNVSFDNHGNNLNHAISENFKENANKILWGKSYIDIQNVIIKNCLGITPEKGTYEHYLVLAFECWLNFINHIYAFCLRLGFSFAQLQVDNDIILNHPLQGQLSCLGITHKKEREERYILHRYLRSQEKGLNVTINTTNNLSTLVSNNLLPFKDDFSNNADFEAAINYVSAFFEEKLPPKIKPLFVRNGNIKSLAFALGNIWRGQSNLVITCDYLQFYKKAFTIFQNHKIDCQNLFSMPLYKYSISKT